MDVATTEVFGSGRFLADGTSPPPALTGEEMALLKGGESFEQIFTNEHFL